MTPDSLRQLREEIGLSPEVLAASMGVSSEDLRSWEAGRAPVPRVAELAAERIALREAAIHADPGIAPQSVFDDLCELGMEML